MTALVDVAALTDYLDVRLPGRGGFSIQRHRAGHSNETFFVARSGYEWVLRRPPLGAFLPSAHDVGREYKVLSALVGTSVRAPTPLVYCGDESVIGVPFYVMEKVAGVVIRDELPETFGQADRGRIGRELVDALVELHSVDPAACGLGDFGRPAGYLERQLRRWRGQLDLTLPMTRPVPDLERTGEWLDSNRPASSGTTIVHGDYKLDNAVFTDGAPARLLSILDWEMSTLGDPLADVGWMLSFWREPNVVGEDVLATLSRVTTQPGFVPRRELARRYEEATGRVLDAIDWYRVLALWKLAILREGSYARHLAGTTDDPFFAQMKEGVPALARRAREVAEGRE